MTTKLLKYRQKTTKREWKPTTTNHR